MRKSTAHIWHHGSMSTPRELARVRTIAEIRRLAWEHLEQHGAAALSLRAIARELGIVSSAIYRYVPSRDDLLTLLITEGYRDLADTVEQALSDLPGGDEAPGRERWLVASHALRGWAVRRPAAWSLLYGSPVPGYSAPPQETTPDGTRVVLRLGAVLSTALDRGEVTAVVGPLSGTPGLTPALANELRTVGGEVEGGLADAVAPAAVAQVIAGWTALLGAVSSEVFGQLGRHPFGDPDVFARVQLATIADLVGLREVASAP